MKELLRRGTLPCLLTFLVCAALAALLDGRWGTALPWALVLPGLLLWCALLTGAEHYAGGWGPAALTVLALGLVLLLADRAALWTAAAGVLAGPADLSDRTLLLLLLVGLAALPVWFLLRHYQVRAALSLGWTALWAAAALLEWALPRLALAAMVPVLLLALAETLLRRRSGDDAPEALLRGLLLSLLPAAVLLSLLPAPETPYDYPLLSRVAEAVERWATRSPETLEFGMSFYGFSEEDDAAPDRAEGGDQGPDLYANPQYDTDGPLYLAGNLWDKFDGRRWTATFGDSATTRMNWSLDTAERLYALWRYLKTAPGLETEDFCRTNSVYLSVGGQKTRTLFTAADALSIRSESGRTYAAAAGGVLFDRTMTHGNWYRVYFLETNARLRDALIRASEGYEYDEHDSTVWAAVAKDLGDSFHLDLSNVARMERSMRDRQVLIERYYLGTTGVSDRAKALAETVTADCKTDYDRVTALAAYLRANYSYSLTPAPLEEDENLLDALLFDRKEGYCTWYATAATLLCRSLGIPARYVQGYRAALPGEVFTSLEAKDSHAWCEAYLAGYGWVIVEATPGAGDRGEGWLTAAEQAALNPEITGAPLPEDDLEAPVGHGGGLAQRPVGGPGGTEIAPETATVPAGEPEKAGGGGWLVVLLTALSLLLLAALFLLLRRRRARAYAAAPPEERLRRDISTLLRHLRRRGYPREANESLPQYLGRLPWRYLPESEDMARQMASLYDRVFFAGKPPKEAEIELHRQFVENLKPTGWKWKFGK